MMESEDNRYRFIYILNIPTLRQKILQYLEIKDLLPLRDVSCEIKLLIDDFYIPFELRSINGFLPMFDLTSDEEMVFRQARSLRALDLSSCYWVTEEILRNILISNPYLTYLNIKHCRVSPTTLRTILVHGRIESEELKLEELEVSLNYHSYEYVCKLIGNCENLRALTLHMTRYTGREDDIVFETLRNCKNLKKLHFFGPVLMNSIIYGFIHMSGCKNIERLTFGENAGIIEKGLNPISNLKNLKELVLDNCGHPDFRDPKIGEHIQILSLNRCGRWVNDSVLEIISRYQNLKKLYLVECDLITRTGINCVINGCPNLEEVFLSDKHDYFPQGCCQQLNVVIHVKDEQSYSYYFYCKTHKLDMYLPNTVD